MNYIHETIIRDLFDLSSELKDVDAIKATFGRQNSGRSIASLSSNLTLVFPVICSKSVNIEGASMVTKAIERKATTMLQLLFAANQIHTSSDLTDYLKKFHSNLKIDNNITVDSVLDMMNKIVLDESVHISDTEVIKLLSNDKKNLDSYLEENVSDRPVLSYKIIPKNRYGASVVYEDDRSSTNSQNSTTSKNNKEFIVKGNLLDNDVKKANELIPTTIVVNYGYATDGGPEFLSAIVGIKAKLYPVDSMDIVDRIVAKNKDTNLLNKFIRATTREISFVKDFLFAIDQAKVDALSQSRKGSSSKMWKILERRSKKSKVKRNLGMNNDAMAITTLVISQEEVDYIKKEYNINLENPSVIRPIMEAYNIMGFCIVDQTNEVAKFIFDTGEDLYENLSFNNLERETSDGGYKKAINLMSKMTR